MKVISYGLGLNGEEALEMLDSLFKERRVSMFSRSPMWWLTNT